MIIIYGLKNCDKCRSALKWFEKQSINYQFYDLRKDGLVKEIIQYWVDVIGWDALINKRSTTWRMLSNEVKVEIDSANANAISYIVDKPTLIKRPIILVNEKVMVGFKEQQRQELININANTIN
ncbi:MAG: Spx/MgsR family RNA polymerase-binding regulatory protein [Pseudomonadota bacterium]|nr:Spx/MgsR family RNA polymerase-binding regulatory protein [Pseudomonadota bacterium]